MWSCYNAHVPIGIMVIVSLIADRGVHRPRTDPVAVSEIQLSSSSTVFAAA
jgi:hypothetical protein